MEIIQVKKEELKFNDLPDIDFKTTLPLLINQNNEVLLGNSIKKCYNNFVDCIRISSNNFLKKCLYNLENSLIKENNIVRLYSIEKELKEYINKELLKFDEFTLFDYKETGFINESNYKQLPEYDFIKHNLVKKKEGEEIADLFSCFGKL